MINLTPISKVIQKRLFEKMKVLGREQIYDSSSPRSKDTLSLNDLSFFTILIFDDLLKTFGIEQIKFVNQLPISFPFKYCFW